MIRALVFVGDRPVVLLGLTAENRRRLTTDQPIRVNLRALDPDGPPLESLPDLDVVIFDGDDPAALAALRKLAAT